MLYINICICTYVYIFPFNGEIKKLSSLKATPKTVNKNERCRSKGNGRTVGRSKANWRRRKLRIGEKWKEKKRWVERSQGTGRKEIKVEKQEVEKKRRRVKIVGMPSTLSFTWSCLCVCLFAVSFHSIFRVLLLTRQLLLLAVSRKEINVTGFVTNRSPTTVQQVSFRSY